MEPFQRVKEKAPSFAAELSLRISSLKPKLPLGRLVITPGAKAILKEHEISTALYRHCRGDWGELDDPDWRANNLSLLQDSRILSAYRAKSGETFWLITEADRSVTTILLPSEY